MLQSTSSTLPPLPARPIGPAATLLIITDYLRTELDAATAAIPAAAAGADPVFALARSVQAHTLNAAVDHLFALDELTAHTTALTDHARRIEDMAALGARAVLATDDENHPDTATATLAITSRARHATQPSRPWWRLWARLRRLFGRR